MITSKNHLAVISKPYKNKLIIIIDGSNVVISTIVKDNESLNYSKEHVRKSNYMRLIVLIGCIKETIERSISDIPYVIIVMFDKKTLNYLYKNTMYNGNSPEEISLDVYIELTKKHHRLRNEMFDNMKNIPCIIKKCPSKADNFIIFYTKKHRNSIVITNDCGIKCKLGDKGDDLCNFMFFSPIDNESQENPLIEEVYIPNLESCIHRISENGENNNVN